MQTTFEPKDIDQILAEADELLQQINAEFIQDMEEEQRALLEEHARGLKELKSQVQGQIEEAGTPESSSYGEGMHEAIEDIVKAMKTMAGYLS
jgi:hypothetical protein